MTKLRPIALQTIKKKWLMTIVCMQVEQIFQHLTHKQQVGCLKGRVMQQYIWSVASAFQPRSQRIVVSFDFSNAFPTLSHNFIEAVLNHIQLPLMLIRFIMSTLKAPCMFCIGQGVVPEVLFFPKAGIGQGDPFSALLFSFCVSFMLHHLSSLQHTDPYLYVDVCTVVREEITQATATAAGSYGRVQGSIWVKLEH